MTLEQLQKALKTSKIAHVARDTGLTRQGIYNIINGKSSPKLDTFNTLVAYYKNLRKSAEAAAKAAEVSAEVSAKAAK